MSAPRKRRNIGCNTAHELIEYGDFTLTKPKNGGIANDYKPSQKHLFPGSNLNRNRGFTFLEKNCKLASMNSQYLEKVVDLTDPMANRILNMTVDEARERILRGPAEAVREIDGSFALVAKEGK